MACKLEMGCRFCGEGNNRLTVEGAQTCSGEVVFYVMCLECGACGPIEDTVEAACARWDGRVK